MSPRILLHPAHRAAAIGAAVVLVDQWSKAITATSGHHDGLDATVPVRNHGFLTGMGAGAGALVIVTAVAVLAAFGAILVRRVQTGKCPAWAAGLLLGGAAGNLLDRLVDGSVRDFLLIGPLVVNVADIAILIGIAAYAITPMLRGQLLRDQLLRAQSSG